MIYLFIFFILFVFFIINPFVSLIYLYKNNNLIYYLNNIGVLEQFSKGFVKIFLIDYDVFYILRIRETGDIYIKNADEKFITTFYFEYPFKKKNIIFIDGSIEINQESRTSPVNIKITTNADDKKEIYENTINTIFDNPDEYLIFSKSIEKLNE